MTNWPLRDREVAALLFSEVQVAERVVMVWNTPHFTPSYGSPVRKGLGTAPPRIPGDSFLFSLPCCSSAPCQAPAVHLQWVCLPEAQILCSERIVLCPSSPPTSQIWACTLQVSVCGVGGLRHGELLATGSSHCSPASPPLPAQPALVGTAVNRWAMPGGPC